MEPKTILDVGYLIPKIIANSPLEYSSMVNVDI
jgi:hypothetical protein